MEATLMFQQMTYIDAYINYISVTCSPHNAKTTIGRYQLTNRLIPIIGKMANNRPLPTVSKVTESKKGSRRSRREMRLTCYTAKHHKRTRLMTTMILMTATMTVVMMQWLNKHLIRNNFNPLKCSGVSRLHFEEFSAIQV